MIRLRYCWAVGLFVGIMSDAMGVLAADSVVDRYGGWMVLRGTATGWFHVEMIGDRELLVTPEGHGFFGLGVNHVPQIELAVLKEQWNAYGFNMTGYNPRAEIAHSDWPYLVLLDAAPITKHHPRFKFPDVFDPVWQKEMEERIRSRCQQHRSHRNLIGYLWIDTPTWDLFTTRGLRGTDWVTETRRLGADAPGRQRYVRFLAERYAGREAECCEQYGIRLASLADLAQQDLSDLLLGQPIIMEDDRQMFRKPFCDEPRR